MPAMSNDRSERGRLGEEYAARLLEREGYRILSRNFRTRYGEIDLIAQKGEILAFVEVKARTGDLFGTPSEAVGRARMERYVKAAAFYFADREIDCVVRFDVIEVEGKKVNHIISAFEA